MGDGEWKQKLHFVTVRSSMVFRVVLSWVGVSFLFCSVFSADLQSGGRGSCELRCAVFEYWQTIFLCDSGSVAYFLGLTLSAKIGASESVSMGAGVLCVCVCCIEDDARCKTTVNVGGAWNQFDARCLVKRFQCNFYWQLFRRLVLPPLHWCLHFILNPLAPCPCPCPCPAAGILSQMLPANEIKSKYRCNCVNCASVWALHGKK